ncbi:uncharacterized protein LOC111403618 [Olea europaea var. sylvestris]|uniref:uncharacterized protein LOC111403618 n=1 Tax=Olea europaea var. sylvestris TaxID=158386 RepID=UPI000C1D82E3|nr:uncharacterized protein LOC111403618 [Olea europaea var. sylvestris]XP_022887955.1 uncharacterized protein LOC111403618 [Olea europaea var. sylvestris]
MALGSEAAEERYEVCPTEDLVRALIENLVDPSLPSRVSKNDPPDLSVQQAVAKQMHAVVLLYNYYHRKQQPKTEFLDFLAFCKLSVVLRHTMIAFMNQGESSDLKYELSVTEKAIRDACNISMALDASKDVPNMEGWPISKVAVLLIDSKKENCLLQFGSVTQGVWSLIEKEIGESNINSEISAKGKVGNKRKRNSRTTDEKNDDDNGFLQLAFDAVKEVTGINSSDLVVLETHILYSLSKEKTAARFYMMQCTQSISEDKRIPVEDVVRSLQGPFVEKICRSWTITPAVEYYHMHPYAGVMSQWFLRKCSSMSSLDGGNSQSTEEVTESRILNLPELKNMNKDLDRVDSIQCQTKDNSFGNLANENSDRNNYKHSSSGKEASPTNISQGPGKDDNGTDECKEINKNHDSSKEADNIDDVLNQNVGKEWPKGSPPCPPGEPQRIDMDAFPRIHLSNEDVRKNPISKIKVYHKKKNSSSLLIDACAPVDSVEMEVEMVDSLKSNGTQDKDDKVSGETCCVSISSNQNGTPLANAELVHLESNQKCIEEVQSTPASEALQNCLTLLYKRRQEVYSQICRKEDELALYEGNIGRIRDGSEVGLALQCIKSITNDPNQAFQPGEDHPEFQLKWQTRLSGNSGSSSFQDLESICIKNNWRLPRYFLEPLDGKFTAEVVLKGKDFKFSSTGDLKTNPLEARESAAARLVGKLQNLGM